ncbi:MAG: c-type cytochrome [Acidiferrobacterales bacterium]
MPNYGVRLVILIIVFLSAAVAAKSYFTVDSFYEYGHYRANSVPEIAATEPVFQGPAYCESCHTDRHGEWSTGVHKVVKCEICHGPAREHPASAKLIIPTDTVKLCTLCHEAMPTRPSAQPQIEVSQHAGTQQCISCHNPHSPRIAGPATAQVTAGPVPAETLSARCASCHGADGLGAGTFPPLAGKQADYLTRRLHDYKSGARQNPMMNMIAKPLSDQEIAQLAAYYASLKGKATE